MMQEQVFQYHIIMDHETIKNPLYTARGASPFSQLHVYMLDQLRIT